MNATIGLATRSARQARYARRWALGVALGWMAGMAGATGATRATHAEGGTPPVPPTRVTPDVDPFIGTDGTGHVTPAASVPFGMVMPGPDHADRGWSYSSGYQWRARRTLGFSNTHISGAGIPELGDVLLMPAAGLRWTPQTGDFAAVHDKRSERAAPGRYAVTLPGHGVQVALTATPRVALHRWRFTRSGTVQVLVDLQHGPNQREAAGGRCGGVPEA